MFTNNRNATLNSRLNNLSKDLACTTYAGFPAVVIETHTFYIVPAGHIVGVNNATGKSDTALFAHEFHLQNGINAKAIKMLIG